ncbi:MAG: hydroxyacid dehydrogenase [Candidatus Marinimicrobia bacterium]|nr:hydroxyacid dehydrogenase [Candidatus Neomarinimicrobiota bacterium]
MKPIITIFEAIHTSGIEYLAEFADIRLAYGVDRINCLKLTSESDAIVVKSVVQVDKELLGNSPRLRVIGRAGTGVDNIDVAEAKKMNIQVLTVPTGNSVSAAEFTLLQILSLCRRLPEVTNSTNENDFRRHLLEGRELQDMTVGLVGLGNVGMLVSERLKAFGCKILGWDPRSKDKGDFISHGGVYVESFEQLLSEVDILSFHARLTPDNYHMMGRKQFQKVKDGLLLINCARADLVDQNALLESVNNGKVAMASLDVLEPEPPFDLHPKEHNYQHQLLKHPRIIVTPHIGASTIEAQKRISLNLGEQLKKALLS